MAMAKSFLGIKAGKSKEKPVIIPDVEEDSKESVSIISIPMNRSERIKMINNLREKTKKNKLKDVTHVASSGDSVMSDVTFHTMHTAPVKLIQTTRSHPISSKNVHNDIPTSHDFILECGNGERIYVPSFQGMVIQSRCKHIKLSLEMKKTHSTSWGGGILPNSMHSVISKSTNEHGIITMNDWSPRTARHMIELLAEGTTWIENDQNRFAEILRACDEINIQLRLGSPINYHDVLDPTSSLRFFKLADAEKYRFQLSGTIKSSQWMELLQSKGILLYLDSKVLMLSSDKPDPAEFNGHDDSVLKRERLSKCDGLYSEFTVYSDRSKINTLYTILGLLSATSTPATTALGDDQEATKHSKSASGNSIFRHRSAQTEDLTESIAVVVKTVAGALEERDLNSLWRMTSTSFTISTAQEKRMLKHSDKATHAPSVQWNLPMEKIRISPSMDGSAHNSIARTASTVTTSSTGTTDNDSIDEPSHQTEGCRSPTTHVRSSPNSPPRIRRFIQHETRTITGTSFMAVKHVFDPVNRDSSDAKASSSDASLLPACLSISNPTPDTLGRFLNACCSNDTTASFGMTTEDETITKIGYDILPSSDGGKNGILFFVSDTTQRVKEILECMADYSKPSAVGDADFKLEQLRHTK